MATLQELNAALVDAQMTYEVLVKRLDNLAEINGDETAIARNKDISDMIDDELDRIDILKRNIHIRERGFLSAMVEVD